jgi:hypothetical protein
MEVEFDLDRGRETFMEAKNSFTEDSTLGSKDKPDQEMDPSMLTTFLETCMKLLCDSKAVKGLQELINRCTRNTSGEPCMVKKIGNHKTRTGQEMILTAQIGEYEMDKVILDLGSDANVLSKKTWVQMGRPMLQWSPIQLRMTNQQKIIPVGWLQGVTVDIEGASALANFKVIEIVDDNNPYPAVLGIDWAINMNGVINPKKRNMIFEKKPFHVIVPLDAIEGSRYTEPICDYESNDNLDYIYKITT